MKKTLSLVLAALSLNVAQAQNSFHFNSTDRNFRQDLGVSSGVLTIGQFVDNCDGRHPENILWEKVRVGIGLNAPTSTLHVLGKFTYQDGSQNPNYVLTSDANGVATWQDPATIFPPGGGDADWFTVGTFTAPTSINDNKWTLGRIGIGTLTPATRLNIDSGMVRVDGGIPHAVRDTTNFFTGGPYTGYQLSDESDFGGMMMDRNGIDASDFTIYFGDNPIDNANDMKFAFAQWTGSKHVFSEYMRLKWNGHFGINTTNPAFRLELPNIAADGDGRARANRWDIYSDARIKTNVRDLQANIETIMKIAPKSYFQHNSSTDNGRLDIKEDGENTIGFIAQDLYKILPMAVSKPADESKSLWSVDYTKVIPVLVGGMQEQQKMINELKAQNQLLMSRLNQLENRAAETTASRVAGTGMTLEQNVPNPFTNTTVIEYSIPHDGLVSLDVFDETGTKALTLVNDHKTAGRYKAVLEGHNLQPGAYFYILKLDGAEQTRKAIKL